MMELLTGLVRDAFGRYPIGLALLMALLNGLVVVLIIGELAGYYSLPYIPDFVDSRTTPPF